MSLAQAMLFEFEHEAKTTRKFLERVPADRLTWKPHEKSHTAGALALHIANVPAGVIRSAQSDQSPLPDFKSLFHQPESAPEILAALDRSIEVVRQELPKFDDARLQQTWSGTVNGKVVVSMPRVGFLRFIMLNHWIQHRGQLGVYLRLLGAKVPSSYGPSGDEGG
ncbi:MAG TPA: DinB family protein [Tepidisphaeraceae bacterium]|nr:DinB family protein [Tepidisphaeraceae bacterium]